MVRWLPRETGPCPGWWMGTDQFGSLEGSPGRGEDHQRLKEKKGQWNKEVVKEPANVLGWSSWNHV